MINASHLLVPACSVTHIWPINRPFNVTMVLD